MRSHHKPGFVYNTETLRQTPHMAVRDKNTGGISRTIISQTYRFIYISERTDLLLSSGWLSSIPTLPSTEASVFRETGTNREVSGGLAEELFDETFLLKSREAAGCCLRNETEPE